MSVRSALFSLQSKLIGAFVIVVLVALVVAASIFVAYRRDDQEKQALDHVIATSPAIYTEFSFLQRQGRTTQDLADYVELASDAHKVRILVVERASGIIFDDTGGALTGQTIVLPEEFDVARPGVFRPYISWHPEGGTPGSGLVLVSSMPSRVQGIDEQPIRGSEPYWLIIAVPESTVSRAWINLLPGLGIAALIALPIAVILGVLVAQYITRPLQRLTLASQRLAEGKFDVEVAVNRRDEVGRLSQAFSMMARRVGEAQEQMRQLVANVSHDLKTPLTSILGFSQALRDGGAMKTEDVEHIGGVLYDEATRLSSRLNDLLLLSELESGEALVQHSDVDLRRLIETSIERIEPLAEQQHIELERDLAEGITVSADAAKLERAVENLLDNARKYTPSGGAISTRLHRVDGRAYIEVANTATDIAPDELPRLFDRFYRRDRTRTQGGGTGLGLSIARELVELNGGSLDAGLRDGQIVFTVSLPATQNSGP